MTAVGALASAGASHFPTFLPYVPGNMESGSRSKTLVVDMPVYPRLGGVSVKNRSPTPTCGRRVPTAFRLSDAYM